MQNKSRNKKILVALVMLLSVGALLASTNVAYAGKKKKNKNKKEEKKSRFEKKYGMKKTTAQVKERRAARREGRKPAKIKNQSDWGKVGDAVAAGTSVASLKEKRETGNTTTYEGSGWYGEATSGCRIRESGEGGGYNVVCAGGQKIEGLTLSEANELLVQANIAALGTEGQNIYYPGYGTVFIPGQTCNATRVTACGDNCECDDCGWRQCYAPAVKEARGRGGTGTGGNTGVPGCSSTQPAQPSVIYPPDGAKISADTVTLQWSQGSMGVSCAGNVNACYLSVTEAELDSDVLAARSRFSRDGDDSPFNVIDFFGKKTLRKGSIFDGSPSPKIGRSIDDIIDSPYFKARLTGRSLSDLAGDPTFDTTGFEGTGTAAGLAGYIEVPCSPGEYTIDVNPGSEYTWEVIASNGTLTNSSGEVDFIVSNLSNLTGYVWDTTGLACSADPSSTEIQPGQVDGEVAVAVGATNGTWDPDGFDGYSYEVQEVPFADGQIICASVPDPTDKPNFRYIMSCLNGGDTGIISGACASIDVSQPAETVDLGFRLASTGWFQSIGGDVFGGCSVDNCAASISVGIPEAVDVLGGFADSLVANIGSVFANSDISVEGDRYSEDDNRHLLNVSSDDFWPSSFSFSAPVDAEEVSDCNGMFGGDLDAGTAYSASRSCVQDGLDNLSGSYSINGDGVAVVFVEGDGSSIVFDKNFQSSDGDRRVMFVAEDSVEITPDVGELAPTTATEANIQASIVTEQSVFFQAIGGGVEDTTAIVEGPLVSKDGSIVFARDRILNNGYPAQVVQYNPIYLTALSDSPVGGVSQIDITWTIQQ